MTEGTLVKESRITANSKYKTRIFEMIFSDKKELLELYNAVNGTHYTDPERLTINTLKNAIYMAMHNDVSFLIDSRLSLYEHQSTYSPNLPLRYLFYISHLYSQMVRDKNLYGSRIILIPTPRFLIFYNGVEKRPEREELRLSEAYTVSEGKPSLELEATLLNINRGYNEELKAECKTLSDYAEYTARVREYAEQKLTLEDAVEKAVNECIGEGILADFLRANRAEAMEMSIFEYDEERHMRQTREEGKQEDRAEAILELLEDLGEIPAELKETVFKQTDFSILKRWFKLAARVNSLEEFQSGIR